jgi:putative FmdB family regulatory protein
MPTYEYACEKCGQSFEVFQSIADAPLTQCPKDKCARPRWGKGRVKRTIHGGAGLLFKGSGFYITDYRSTGYQEAAKKDSSAATPAPAAKPDAKPATPAPAKATKAKADAA